MTSMTITFFSKRRKVSILSPDYVISPPHPHVRHHWSPGRGCHHMIRPSSHDITYHSAFLLLKSSQRRPQRVTFSQCRPSCRQAPRAKRCLQEQPGTLGGSCRLLRRTLGGWPALSRLGRALKLAPAQVTKGRAGPFFTYTTVNDFTEHSGAGGLWSFSFY